MYNVFLSSDVAELTGAPEMLGGRVKTLHPAVHGGNVMVCIGFQLVSLVVAATSCDFLCHASVKRANFSTAELT